MTPTPSRAAVRTAVVDAAAALLRDGGTRAVTTRAVAQAAGVQAPTIYRLFGDKDGLVDAVAERVVADWVATKSASVADDAADPVQALRDGWRDHVAFGLAHPELYALLSTPGRPRSASTDAGVDVLRRRVHRVAAAGLLRTGEERAVAMVHAAGTGAVLTLLARPADDRDPGLADAMLDAVLAVVTTSAPAVDAPGPLAVAVGFATVVPELPGLRATERALLADWVGRAVEQLQSAVDDPSPPAGTAADPSSVR